MAMLEAKEEAVETVDGVTETTLDLSDLSTDMDFSTLSVAVLADIFSSEDLETKLKQILEGKVPCRSGNRRLTTGFGLLH